MRNSILILTGALALGLSGCVDRAAQEQAKQTQAIVTNPVKSVSVEAAKTQSMSETLQITGQVATADDSQVSAKQSGRLTRVYVSDGSPVSAGQLIAEQDASQLQAQYRQALAGIASAQSQLSQAISNANLTPTKSLAAVRTAQAQVASANQQYRSAQANLNKVKAGDRPEQRLQTEALVRNAKSGLDKAQRDLDRAKTLVAQGAVAQSELDAAQAAYDSALANYQTAQQTQQIQLNGARTEDIAIAQAAVDQARDGIRQAQEGVRSAQAAQKLDVLLNDAVRTAQAQVSVARAQADAARAAVDDTRIRSPFSGKIAGKPLQAGSIASPGTTIARIVGPQGAYFESQVSEESIRFVTIGRSVAVTVDALPGQKFFGTILAVSGVGSDVGRLFTVRIGLTGNLGEIKPGMFARGVAEVRTVPNAVVVQSTAVVRKNNQDTVFIADGDKAKAVAVTKGIAQGNYVQVVGIKPGDSVIVQGQSDLDDKAKIKVDKAPAAATSAPAGAGPGA